MALFSAAAPALADVRIEPGLRLTAEERFDDASFLRMGATAGGQLLTRLSAEPRLSIRSATTEVGGWYAADLLAHHGSGTIGVDHRGQLAYRQRLSLRSELSAVAQIWRVSDPTSLPRVGLARTLSPILYGRLDLDGRTELSRRVEGRAAYRFEGARILEAGQPPGTYHAPSLALRWALSPRLELGTEYRFQLFTEGASTAFANGGFAFLRYRLSRLSYVSLSAGPVYFAQAAAAGPSGWLPRVSLEIGRDGRYVDLALSAGEDLVGASGFTSALWAHYVQGVGSWNIRRHLRLYAAASYYRNGSAPSVGVNPFQAEPAGVTQGYVVGAGLEWRLLPVVSAVATVDRFAQVGGGDDAVAWNIAGVRLVLTAW